MGSFVTVAPATRRYLKSFHSFGSFLIRINSEIFYFIFYNWFVELKGLENCRPLQLCNAFSQFVKNMYWIWWCPWLIASDITLRFSSSWTQIRIDFAFDWANTCCPELLNTSEPLFPAGLFTIGISLTLEKICCTFWSGCRIRSS